MTGRITHGHARAGRRSPEYSVWCSIISRCTNPKKAKYQCYGGRGISVCVRWEVSFENFYADMGPRPSPKHSIEREDNDGNYEPGNCRWATQAEQSRNKRNNVYIELDGERLCMTDAARRVGLKPLTLLMRLRNGWTPEKALRTPARPRRLAGPNTSFIDIDGKRVPLIEAAKAAGLRPNTVRDRLGRGWSPERALSTPTATSQQSV